jgi:hypothetical protein
MRTIRYEKQTKKVTSAHSGESILPDETGTETVVVAAEMPESLDGIYYDTGKKILWLDADKKAETEMIAAEEAKIATEIYKQQRAAAISALGSELKKVKT